MDEDRSGRRHYTPDEIQSWLAPGNSAPPEVRAAIARWHRDPSQPLPISEEDIEAWAARVPPLPADQRAAATAALLSAFDEAFGLAPGTMKALSESQAVRLVPGVDTSHK